MHIPLLGLVAHLFPETSGLFVVHDPPFLYEFQNKQELSVLDLIEPIKQLEYYFLVGAI